MADSVAWQRRWKQAARYYRRNARLWQSQWRFPGNANGWEHVYDTLMEILKMKDKQIADAQAHVTAIAQDRGRCWDLLKKVALTCELCRGKGYYWKHRQEKTEQNKHTCTRCMSIREFMDWVKWP